MPDWAAITLGVVLGVGGGLALGYGLLAWYMSKERP